MTVSRLKVTCPHGATFEASENAESTGRWAPEAVRLLLRNMLLACPRCRMEAEGFIREPGL